MSPRNRHEPLVPPRYEREDDSVAGPFYVMKDVCITCDLPPITAPSNITFDEKHLSSNCEGCPNHCRVSKQPETDEELELMIEAACGSCVEAIRYCGTDALTLARFRHLGEAKLCDALPAPKDADFEKPKRLDTKQSAGSGGLLWFILILSGLWFSGSMCACGHTSLTTLVVLLPFACLASYVFFSIARHSLIEQIFGAIAYAFILVILINNMSDVLFNGHDPVFP